MYEERTYLFTSAYAYDRDCDRDATDNGSAAAAAANVLQVTEPPIEDPLGALATG